MERIANLYRLLIILLACAFGIATSTVVLITPANNSLPFPDIEANFAPRVPTVGVMGVVIAADPLNACRTLLQTRRQNGFSAFLLVERGDCDFVTKVKHAQAAGYTAAIIYNNEDGQDLVTMSGSGTGIDIYAVLVSKQAGKALQLCAGDMNSRCYLVPAFKYTASSVMALAFISLLTVFAVLSTIFFVRRHRLRLIGAGLFQRQHGGMTSKELKALPIILFDSAVCANVETCAICLEEYTSGEKLRILPCSHGFHVACIDQWLTTRWSFCPICKQDAHSKKIKEPISEHTPLLAPCATQFGSMVYSNPVSVQSFQNRSPLQIRDNFANPFTKTPQAAHHALSCPIAQFYGEEDDVACSFSHLSTTNATSSILSISHCECGLNSSLYDCDTSSNVDNLAPVVDEEAVSHTVNLC